MGGIHGAPEGRQGIRHRAVAPAREDLARIESELDFHIPDKIRKMSEKL